MKQIKEMIIFAQRTNILFRTEYFVVTSLGSYAILILRQLQIDREQVLRLEPKLFPLTFNFLLAWFHFMSLGNS